MSERTTTPRERPPQRDDDEVLLARCIERFPELGADSADAVCPDDPARSSRLRARLATLERLGLLAERTANTSATPLSIGRHRVLDFLGQGGMGAVYLGLDERHGRRVAIKIGHAPLDPRPAGGSSDVVDRARARFDREIRAVAQLEHPGIVAIHDVGESEGRPFFAMEFVAGVTLAQIVEELRERRTPFELISTAAIREFVASGARAGDPDDTSSAPSAWEPTYVETACRWVIELAGALAHAHEHAIVHRDVKPSNVMVRRDGHIKLFDLGLARVGDQPALTRSGDVAGSPFYMSPEQIAGPHAQVDHRTDVYSLGVTLFELLTLRRPFEGPTSAHVFRQIVGKEPPLLRRLNPLVPRDLETICLTALEKDPERRYQSMQEFAEDLQRFLAFQPVRAKPAGVARKGVRFVRRNPALASALLLAGLLVVGLPIGLLWANAAIRGEERRAAREAALKSSVTDFLVDQFELTEPERAQGATISARVLLDRGVERIESEFEDDPLVRAALLAATGTVYKNLGLYDRAIPLLDRALAIRQSAVEEDAPAMAELLNDLAGAHLAAGHPETARRLCERGLRGLDGHANVGSEHAVALHRTLADSALLMGAVDDAERSLSQALAILRASHGARDGDTAAVLERLGAVSLERGDVTRARAQLADAMAIYGRAWSPDLASMSRVLDAQARADDAAGDAKSAEARRREAARYASTIDGPPPAARLSSAFDPEWKEEYDREFQLGITALQSREFAQATRAFERCLELDPRRPVCAYNIACGYALSGDVERGLQSLERAADLGFGVADYQLRVAESDAEIANLRADPRGAAILERMRRYSERVRAFAGQPAVYLPRSLPRDKPWPLLVVLHAEGRTKSDVIAGPWRAVADSLGAALLAPSGPIPTAAEPEQGMTWLEDASDLVRKPVTCERDVTEAARTFLAHHDVDRSAVWIAGEGLGAMVAFDVALRAPGLFKGVVLIEGTIHPDTPLEHARKAAALGLRVAVVADQGASPVEAWLVECGFAAPEAIVSAPGKSGDREALVRDVLARWSR